MKCKSVYCSRQLNDNKNALLYRKHLEHVKSRRNPSIFMLLEPIPARFPYTPLTPCSLTVLHPGHNSVGALHVKLETWTHHDTFSCFIPHFPGGVNLEKGSQNLTIRTVETIQEGEMFTLYFFFKACW